MRWGATKLDRKVYGYWPLSALRRTQGFQRIVSWVMRTVTLRYRLAQELGPAPKFAATTSGIWLGPWDNGALAIGVVGTPQGLRSVLSGYGDKAEKVYPYPIPYLANLGAGSMAPQLLLMVFRHDFSDLRAAVEIRDWSAGLSPCSARSYRHRNQGSRTGNRLDRGCDPGAECSPGCNRSR